MQNYTSTRLVLDRDEQKAKELISEWYHSRTASSSLYTDREWTAVNAHRTPLYTFTQPVTHYTPTPLTLPDSVIRILTGNRTVTTAPPPREESTDIEQECAESPELDEFLNSFNRGGTT